VLEFVIPFAAAKFMGLIKAIEVAAGAALLANRFVPLALTLLAPILVGIVNFHAALAPSGLPLPLVLIALELGLAWSYRDAFAPLFHARTAPHAVAREVRRTAAA
jgi:putative oxidoreductase